MARWVETVPLTSIEEEDLARFDHEGRSYVLVRTGGEVYALDGLWRSRKVRALAADAA